MTHRKKRDLDASEIAQIESEITRATHKEVATRHNVKLSTIRNIAHKRNKASVLPWWAHGADFSELEVKVTEIVLQADKDKKQ